MQALSTSTPTAQAARVAAPPAQHRADTGRANTSDNGATRQLRALLQLPRQAAPDRHAADAQPNAAPPTDNRMALAFQQYMQQKLLDMTIGADAPHLTIFDDDEDNPAA